MTRMPLTNLAASAITTNVVQTKPRDRQQRYFSFQQVPVYEYTSSPVSCLNNGKLQVGLQRERLVEENGSRQAICTTITDTDTTNTDTDTTNTDTNTTNTDTDTTNTDTDTTNTDTNTWFYMMLIQYLAHRHSAATSSKQEHE